MVYAATATSLTNATRVRIPGSLCMWIELLDTFVVVVNIQLSLFIVVDDNDDSCFDVPFKQRLSIP